MKTVVSKHELYAIHKMAFFHRFSCWLTVPYFLITFAALVSVIIQGASFGLLCIVLFFVVSLGFINYEGFKSIYLCKKFKLDYKNPLSKNWWNEI